MLTGIIKLLREDGSFYVILPLIETQIFREKANIEGLHLKRELLIYPKKGKQANRVISCFGLFKQEIFSEYLDIRTGDGLYTNEYRKLTRDYYLDF